MKLILLILYNFIVGTICLVYGVNLVSTGLEKANVNVMKKVITKFTGRVSSAFITGTLATALVQSSTAITVITVGLVNSGIMKLVQAVGIIYGANIGTTITAQLMSFNVTDFAFPILLIGLTVNVFAKKKSVKSIGKAITGLGLMFVGLGILNSGAPLIKESELAYSLFEKYGTNPCAGLVIGTLTTALVHSSSATTGLTIVLFNTGLINFDASLGLIFGDNIGTCITAQAASLKSKISARRTAWAHTIYNIIGVVIVMFFISPFAKLVELVTGIVGQNNTRLVANAHAIFNILSAVVFLPITNYYVRFIEWIIPDRKK